MKGGRNACSTVSLICLNYRKPALTKILRPLELIKAGFVESWGRGALLVQAAAHCRSWGGEEKKTGENKKKQARAGLPLNIHIL